MRQRVLRNLEQAQTRKRKNNILRQVMPLAACVAIVLCCWYAWKPRRQEQGVQMGSQIENVDSLKSLSQKTGIPLEELTGRPFEVVRTEYVFYWTELAEIQYFGQTACVTGNPLEWRIIPGTTTPTPRKKHWNCPAAR